MSERLHVDAEEPLLRFLERRLSSWKRSTLKQRLAHGGVRVGDVVTTAAHHPLHPGDVVTVGEPSQQASRGRARTGAPPQLYLDDVLVAIDKPAGLLSVSSERERQKTALAQTRASLGKGARLWPVHRLDRETSGVLLFARTKEAREQVQARWGEAEKTYAVVVEGCPEATEGIIEQPLWEDRALNVHVGPHRTAKDARTRWRVLSRHGPVSLLTVTLDTGRKHQIRAHLKWLGHPVVGDERYGTRRAPRLGLHAEKLVVTHPLSQRTLQLIAPPPKAFVALYQ